MRNTLFTLLSVALLGLSGCTNDKPPVPVASNADVESSIKSRLNANADLERANLNVDANINDKRLTLSGTVESEALRTKAVEIAQTAQPQMQVTDKIDVKPRDIPRTEFTEEMARDTRARVKSLGQKVGDSLDDAWIHTKITAQLAKDSDTPARNIDVDVVNNVVTLRGSVSDAKAKEEAGRIATKTDGVKRVINKIVVNAG